MSLRLSGVRSLKEKRHLLRGAIEKVGRDPMIGVAEVADQDLWGNADIGVCAVGNSIVHIEQILQRAEEVFANDPRWELSFVERHIEPLDG